MERLGENVRGRRVILVGRGLLDVLGVLMMKKILANLLLNGKIFGFDLRLT